MLCSGKETDAKGRLALRWLPVEFAKRQPGLSLQSLLGDLELWTFLGVFVSSLGLTGLKWFEMTWWGLGLRKSAG